MLGNGAALSVLALASVALAIGADAQEHLVGLGGVCLYSPQSADRVKIEREIDDAVSGLGMLKRGNAVKASVRMGAGVLYQTLEGAQGTRDHEFHFREDGTVSVWTRIESEHLPARLNYSLSYHRAPYLPGSMATVQRNVWRAGAYVTATPGGNRSCSKISTSSAQSSPGWPEPSP